MQPMGVQHIMPKFHACGQTQRLRLGRPCNHQAPSQFFFDFSKQLELPRNSLRSHFPRVHTQIRNLHLTLLFFSQGPFGSEDRKVGGQKMRRGWKSGRIEKILVFFICVWLEGWKSEGMTNFFTWLERKMGGQKMEFV